MKQPVDFRPEKPQIDLPDTTLKPSVRLPGSLTLPDGRTMLDPPTIELDGMFDAPPSPRNDDMKPLSKKEPPSPKALRLPPLYDPPAVEIPRKISGTETLFKSGDLLDRLDSIVGEAESLQEDFQLPEIPPLPIWERKFKEPCSRDDTMIPHAPFEPRDESVPEASDAAPEVFDPFPVETTETTDTKTGQRYSLPVLRSSRPAVFRQKIRPAKSLELVLPAPPPPKEEVVPPTISQTIRPTGGELLLTEGLTKSYYKKKLKIPVLKGVNFYVDPGEFVSIVGQSGSGKSTLLHLLGTLDNPESGTIHFEGRRIDNLPAGKRDLLRNRSIGFIFQFYHLLPELSTLENVLSPLMIRESAWSYFLRRRDNTDRAKAILEQVGLSHRLKHKPCELSGGEMQRAAIARALISEPKILLADEPTGNLDSASAREIIELLRKLKEERNLTVVMVTHDNMIAKTADRIVRMVDGVIVSSDDSRLLDRP